VTSPAAERARRCWRGRPLAAAHAALPISDEAHLRRWWAVTALREHRGDGHVAALVDAELSGIEALVSHAAAGDVPAEVLRTTRGWSQDEWSAAVDGLVWRGLVESDGSSPPAGAELRALVRPWSKAVFAGVRPGRVRQRVVTGGW